MGEMDEPNGQFGKCGGNGEIQISSGRRRFGSGGLVSGPGEGLRAGQSSCCVGLGDALQLPKEDLASAMRVLRASEASAVRMMALNCLSLRVERKEKVR